MPTKLRRRSFLIAPPEAAGNPDSGGKRYGPPSDLTLPVEIARFNSKALWEVVVGVGGGKTLDTAKAVAYHTGLPMVIVPTIASTDAATSALAVIYTPEGEFDRYLFLPHNPDLVLVDTRVIVDAPVEFLVSGMGDALATWFEAESARQSYAPNMTGNLGSMTAYTLAEVCFETLM